MIEKFKNVDFISLFKILIIFITLTQLLKSIKNIIVLENSIFVLEINMFCVREMYNF